MTDRAYYLNSLKAWRGRLMHEQKLISARFARMEKMKHPDTNDQGLLMGLNQEMIELVDDAIRKAKP